MIAQQFQKPRNPFPMFGKAGGRQVFQFGEITALGFDLVHHLGQAVGQGGALRKGQKPAASGTVPLPDQPRQQQLPPQRRDGGCKLQSLAGGIEQKFVFLAVTQGTKLRQQRRAAHHMREGVAETARRAAGGQVDDGRRQRQRIVSGARDHASCQRFREGGAGGNGENRRVFHAADKAASAASASSRACGVPT